MLTAHDVAVCSDCVAFHRADFEQAGDTDCNKYKYLIELEKKLDTYYEQKIAEEKQALKGLEDIFKQE